MIMADARYRGIALAHTPAADASRCISYFVTDRRRNTWGVHSYGLHPKAGCMTPAGVLAAGLVALAVAVPEAPAMTPAVIAADVIASSTRPAARPLEGRPETSLTGLSLRLLARV